ncbi:hypothetical protein BpHYR1_010560 [Brachionus plicatilis]|uniref:Uncharacterized protein n=1 Tax=Brachionus plicatilis TaxID=10195 RepID=A0A3M7T889_BRAPC|nr:hypothetical protein BpHYR1_010560 [Brachionus plicatilis]
MNQRDNGLKKHTKSIVNHPFTRSSHGIQYNLKAQQFFLNDNLDEMGIPRFYLIFIEKNQLINEAESYAEI